MVFYPYSSELYHNSPCNFQIYLMYGIHASIKLHNLSNLQVIWIAVVSCMDLATKSGNQTNFSELMMKDWFFCVCVYQLLPWKLLHNLVQSLSVLLPYSYVKVADYLFPKSTIITSDNTVTKSLS